MGALKYYNSTTEQWEYITNNPSVAAIISSEEMAGSINGTNKDFTTTQPFSTIDVYKNGVHLRQGATNDYVVTGANKITLNTAPVIGTSLSASYATASTANISGANSFIFKETPGGLVDGTNGIFTTSRPYIANSLQVYVNGLAQSNYVAETNPAIGTFTIDAPSTGSTISVSYQYAASVSGNADTVDGQHASVLSPIGIINPYAGIVAPTGWLLCDGDLYGEEEYPDLFAAIGYNYGGIPGAFAVPNLGGRVPVGRDQYNTLFDTLGETGGMERTRHATMEPGLNSGKMQDMGQEYAASVAGDMQSWIEGGGGADWSRWSTVRGVGGTVRTGGTANVEVRHDRYTSTNLQPYQVVNYIIKAI